jgi:hypothetical protein
LATFTDINSTLQLIDEAVFKNCGLHFSKLEIEKESRQYAACNFKLGIQTVQFRIAKITPTKTGQFVTIWKRDKKGITQPFSVLDDIDLYLIVVRKENEAGLFIFPKSVLHQNKILSDNIITGKRGIRVYPNWDTTTNKQAQKTQEWQIKYFLKITSDKNFDLNKAKLLFNSIN